MLTQYSWVFSQWLIPLALTHSSSPLRILIFHSSLACLPHAWLRSVPNLLTLFILALSLPPRFSHFSLLVALCCCCCSEKRAECSNERRPNAPKWLNMYRNEEFSPYIKKMVKEEEEPYVPSSSTSHRPPAQQPNIGSKRWTWSEWVRESDVGPLTF